MSPAQSKLANILYAKQLQKVLASSHPDAPITVLAMHPRSVNTEGYHNDPTNSIPIFERSLRFFLTLYFLSLWEVPEMNATRVKYMGA